MTRCPHPPARLYCGTTFDPGTGKHQIWVACCDCGALLKNAISAKTRRELARQEAQR